MAEFMLKVGSIGNPADETTLKDGDIIHAFNDKRIQYVNSQNICSPYLQTADLNEDGYLAVDSLAYNFMNEYSKYRFERVENSVMRIDIANQTIEDWSNEINVTEFIAQQKPFWTNTMIKNLELTDDKKWKQGLPLFGTHNREVYFQGVKEITQPLIDNVWTDITAKKGLLKSAYKIWLYGKLDVCDHLLIAVDDFDDEEMCNLECKCLGEDGSITKERRHKVDWETYFDGHPDISTVTIAHAKDKTYSLTVQDKEAPHVRANIVIDKEA